MMGNQRSEKRGRELEDDEGEKEETRANHRGKKDKENSTHLKVVRGSTTPGRTKITGSLLLLLRLRPFSDPRVGF